MIMALPFQVKEEGTEKKEMDYFITQCVKGFLPALSKPLYIMHSIPGCVVVRLQPYTLLANTHKWGPIKCVNLRHNLSNEDTPKGTPLGTKLQL